MSRSSENLIWIDLEMTGLDFTNDCIIEIATIITDNQLNLIEEGPVIAIHIEDAIIATMDTWNTECHTRSGLIDRVRKSKCSTAEAEKLTLEFLQKHILAKTSPMCGNSICQDRRFMARLMPELEAYFHYRNLDVSSLKILVNRWVGDKQQYSKESMHVALNDVRDSINELKFYREKYLKI